MYKIISFLLKVRMVVIVGSYSSFDLYTTCIMSIDIFHIV